MIHPRHFRLLVWGFILAGYSLQAKPTWTFSVVVAVEKQTADFYQTMLSRPIDQIVRDQMATINANFNSSSNFNGIYNFRVDSIYVFDGPPQAEVFRAHPRYTYAVVIDGKFTEPAVGGGWYGSHQTVYHSWPWSDAFASGPFGPGATDGLTHEFGHARGGIDIYGLRVEGSNNPINGQTFEPVRSIMNYPYGNIVWDEYTTNLLNSTADGPIQGEDWITRPFPNTFGLKAVDTQGAPLSRVTLELYPVNWLSYAVSSTPVLTASTNDDGIYTFPTNPYQPNSISSPWHIRYPNFLVKATYNSVVAYAWMPLYDVQNAYFRNGPAAAFYTQLQFAPFPADFPTIQLASLNATRFCPYDEIEVAATVSGVFQPDNTFSLQVSDANGNFANGHNIDRVTGTSVSTLAGYIGSAVPSTNYMIRIVSSNPYAQSNVLPFTVKPIPDPPTVQPLVVCQNNPPPVLQANGQNLRWYTSFSGGGGSPIPPTPNTSQTGQVYYYVSQTVDGCESRFVTLPVIISAIYTVKSGQWTDPAVWSCNRVPNQADEPIISTGHSVSITGTASVKRIVYHPESKLILSVDGRLALGKTD